MDRILEKTVAILGGGATAQPFAADSTPTGYKIHLHDLTGFIPKTWEKFNKHMRWSLEANISIQMK